MDKQFTKQVMNQIEKAITDAQDMLNDKRDRYVMHNVHYDESGRQGSTQIVNREAQLQFALEHVITQLENLSGDIFDETGIDCDLPGGE